MTWSRSLVLIRFFQETTTQRHSRHRNGHNMWRFAETNREKRRKIRRKVYAFHLTDFWDSRSLYVRASACVEISQRNASILLTADRQFWSALKLGISPDGYGNPMVVNQFCEV